MSPSAVLSIENETNRKVDFENIVDERWAITTKVHTHSFPSGSDTARPSTAGRSPGPLGSGSLAKGPSFRSLNSRHSPSFHPPGPHLGSFPLSEKKPACWPPPPPAQAADQVQLRPSGLLKLFQLCRPVPAWHDARLPHRTVTSFLPSPRGQAALAAHPEDTGWVIMPGPAGLHGAQEGRVCGGEPQRRNDVIEQRIVVKSDPSAGTAPPH